MTDSLKVQFDLDLSKESDRQLIEVISRVKALQAQGETPSVVSAAASASHAPVPTTQAVRDVGKKITQVANELADALPRDPGQKLSNAERARIAAKARWARAKAEKEGKPIPPTAREVKKKERSSTHGLDFRGAKEQQLSEFQEIPGETFGLELQSRHNAMMHALMNNRAEEGVPDGREILDGSWEEKSRPQGNDEYDDIDDAEYVRGIHEQASRFDTET